MNPQTMAIGVFAVVLWLPTVALIAAYLFRRLHTQERLKAIEKGLDLAFDPEASAASTRRTGIVFIAAAIGIAAAVGIVTVVARDLEALALLALAVVPCAIGLGFLLDYRIQRNQAKARQPGNPHAR